MICQGSLVQVFETFANTSEMAKNDKTTTSGLAGHPIRKWISGEGKPFDWRFPISKSIFHNPLNAAKNPQINYQLSAP